MCYKFFHKNSTLIFYIAYLVAIIIVGKDNSLSATAPRWSVPSTELRSLFVTRVYHRYYVTFSAPSHTDRLQM